MAIYEINNDLDHNNDDGCYFVPAESPEALRRYSSSVDRRATIDLDEKEESLNLRTTRRRFLVLGLYMACASFQTYTTNCLNPMSLANSPSVSFCVLVLTENRATHYSNLHFISKNSF